MKKKDENVDFLEYAVKTIKKYGKWGYRAVDKEYDKVVKQYGQHDADMLISFLTILSFGDIVNTPEGKKSDWRLSDYVTHRNKKSHTYERMGITDGGVRLDGKL